MNTALAILAHALRMLIFETATTVRVIMPALLLVLGCGIGIALLAPETVAMLQAPPDAPLYSPDNLAIFFAFGVVGLLGYALMAVLWHRHVLLNGAEQPQDLHPNAGIFFGYVWRAIVVGFVQMIAATPITIAMGVLGGIFIQGNPGGFAALLIGTLGGLAFIWIALRLSVVLPAAAIGYAMPVRESWEITKPVAAALWGVALLLSGLNMCVYVLSNILLPDTGTMAVLAQTLIFLIEGLVFVSVLTTLYGHLVEGRSLGQ